MEKEFNVSDIVKMKKKHPCGENRWEILRMGADVKIQCKKCGRMVMLSRKDFLKGATKI